MMTRLLPLNYRAFYDAMEITLVLPVSEGDVLCLAGRTMGLVTFMQDNDPKHTSRKLEAKDFFAARSINWWKTPPEPPNMNPTENLWHELKEYIQREVKSRIKQQ